MKTLILKFLSISLLVSVLSICDSIGQAVYVTKTGSKYHLSGCQYLKSSSMEIDLKDAKDRGYGPCSVCRPPVTISGGPTGTKKSDETKNSEDQVLICISKSAYAYHSHYCSGLNRCTHTVSKVAISDAEKMGYKPFGFCY